MHGTYLRLKKKMLFMWNSNLTGYLAFFILLVRSDSPRSWTRHLFCWWPWKMSEVRFLWSRRKERMRPQPGSARVVGVQVGLQREETGFLCPTPAPEPCGEGRTSPDRLTCKENAPSSRRRIVGPWRAMLWLLKVHQSWGRERRL